MSSATAHGPLIVFTTTGNMDDAARIATALVEQQFAACVNIVSGVRSIYAWEGKIVDDEEQLLVIKTTGRRLEELRTALLAMHPYAVPEFVVVVVDQISEPYRTWLLGATGSA